MWIPLGPTRDPNQNHIDLVPRGMSGVNTRLQPKSIECETSTKEPEYKNMRYLTFAPVTDLEKELFQKCSFDQPPMSYPYSLRASDKLSPGFKSTYSNATCWLQQSKQQITFGKMIQP